MHKTEPIRVQKTNRLDGATRKMATTMSILALKHSVTRGEFALDVDTEIPATGVTGVLGESGSGKTTLLRCIAGLERSAGTDLTPAHKRSIGYVFQEP